MVFLGRPSEVPLDLTDSPPRVGPVAHGASTLTRAASRSTTAGYARTDAAPAQSRDWRRELVEKPRSTRCQGCARRIRQTAGHGRGDRRWVRATHHQTSTGMPGHRDRCLGGGAAGIALVRTRHPGRPSDATQFGMTRTGANIPILAGTWTLAATVFARSGYLTLGRALPPCHCRSRGRRRVPPVGRGGGREGTKRGRMPYSSEPVRSLDRPRRRWSRRGSTRRCRPSG